MKGQALVTLIFFMVFATTITTAAVLVIVTNSISGAKFEQGTMAYQVAESGVENALIRILRDPNYKNEILSVGNGTATILVTGSGTVSDPYVINSTGQSGNFIKKIQLNATYLNDQMNVVSQKEVF